MIQTLIFSSTEYLTEHDVMFPKRTAEELIAHVLKIDYGYLYLDEREVTLKEKRLIQRLLKKRAVEKIPLEYLLGSKPFYFCDLSVGKGVFIPRRETEELVEKVKTILAEEKESLFGKNLWDLCTGSGSIGIALKKLFPQLQITLSDLSKKSLKMAKNNSLKNGIFDLQFLEGDLLKPFGSQKAHFMVSNPPYIAKHEKKNLSKEVLHEPKRALFGGSDGLSFYRKLAKILPHYLYPNAKIFFEMGENQGSDLKILFSKPPYKNLRIERDSLNKERFFFLEVE